MMLRPRGSLILDREGAQPVRHSQLNSSLNPVERLAASGPRAAMDREDPTSPDQSRRIHKQI